MGSPKSPERDETPHTRFCDLKAFEMLNDLLMLTKFNRNAESERASGLGAAHSVAVRNSDSNAMWGEGASGPREREREGQGGKNARLTLKRGGEY